jgi:serine protease Do
MTKTTNAAVLVGVMFAYALGAQTQAQRTPQALAQFSASIEDLARAASPAVVQITVRGRAPLEEGGLQQAGFLADQRAMGSGVIVDPDGYIVTTGGWRRGSRRGNLQ